MRVRSSRTLDETASAATALLRLASELVDSGDLGTAHQVAQSLTDFMNLHLGHVRRARRAAVRRSRLREHVRAESLRTPGMADTDHFSNSRATLDDMVAPINPILRDVLRETTRRAILTGGPAFAVHEYVLRSLLRSSSHADMAVSMATASLPVDEIDSAMKMDAAVRILRLTGLQALEHRDANSYRFVLRRARELAKREVEVSQVQDLVCDLASYACRYVPELANAACDTLKALVEPVADGERFNSQLVQSFWLVGGAALAVGAHSAALYAARILACTGAASTVVALSSSRDNLEALADRAKFFGSYLGDRPQDALAIFGKFLNRYQEWLAATT